MLANEEMRSKRPKMSDVSTNLAQRRRLKEEGEDYTTMLYKEVPLFFVKLLTTADYALVLGERGSVVCKKQKKEIAPTLLPTRKGTCIYDAYERTDFPHSDFLNGLLRGHQSSLVRARTLERLTVALVVFQGSLKRRE